MRSVSRYTLAIVAALSVAGPSIAQTALQEGVSIVYVSRDDRSDDSGKILPPLNNETQRQAQMELDGNAQLKSILQKHNVELNNVVGIETAANGEKIVYVK